MLFICSLYVVPYLASAQIDYKLAAPLPGGPDTVPGSGFIAYARFLLPFLLSFAAVMALLQFVWGGITYMVSDSITSKEDSRDRMWKAVLGLLLALASVLILRTINPKLIELSLDLPPVGEKSGSLVEEAGSLEDQAGSLGAKLGQGCDFQHACAPGGVCAGERCRPANLGPDEECLDGPQCVSGVCEKHWLNVPTCK